MFRTATYKPAICECDVFREEGDHQNRNAFTILIYSIALLFIVALFSTVIYFRDSAEIRQVLYEPCNGTLSIKEVKGAIEHGNFMKGLAENMAYAKDRMKEAFSAMDDLLGKEAREKHEKEMDDQFHKPMREGYQKSQNTVTHQIFKRNKCAQENFQHYLLISILRTSSAIALIAIFLALFWFIFLFIISTQYIKSKFTQDEYLKVQSRTHKLFVISLIAMITFAIIMYCQDFYVSVYVNTFEKALYEA